MSNYQRPQNAFFLTLWSNYEGVGYTCICLLSVLLCPAWYDRRDIMSFRPSVHPSCFRGTTLHAAPSKNYARSTNYHACIAMPTWSRCAPPILCWPWPQYNLLTRSCLTWIFFVDPHWWVPHCVQHPAKAMPFQQIIMHALQCQHDRDVHLLFCVDHDLHITSSRGRVELGFFSSILTVGYHFACSAQQKLCFFNKLSCMHCTTNMM